MKIVTNETDWGVDLEIDIDVDQDLIATIKMYAYQHWDKDNSSNIKVLATLEELSALKGLIDSALEKALKIEKKLNG